MSICVAAVSNGLRRLWVPAVSQVRFRYHQDKIDNPIIKRYGYKDEIIGKGLLPRVKDPRHLPGTLFVPSDPWSREKAMFGQNDYIDLFTDNMHPTKVHYGVPAYLRGFKGNEFQCLLRKQKMLKHGELAWQYPTQWRQVNKRIGYLYKYLNRKTRTWYAYRSRLCG